MTETHVIREPAGTITVTQAVLGQVVRRAAEEAEGVRVRRSRRRGPEVEVESGRARVSVELAVRYGVVLPDAAGEAQARIAERLRSMCGLEAGEIDVTVEELD